MRKYIIGFVVGLVLSLPFAAGADSVVGKVIQGTFPLFIDGERAGKDVIVVDGTSYLSVRAAGEMFGYDVSFDNENRSVILNKKETATTTSQAGDTVNTTQNYYYVKSSVIDVWHRRPDEKITYYVKDGVTYVPIQIFHNYATWEGDGNKYELPNGVTLDVKATGKEEYSPGVLFFVNERGMTFIDISKLGYTIRVDGDTLWIEE